MRETYKHLERVEREFDTANRRWEVRLHVRVLTGGANRLCLGCFHRNNTHVDTECYFFSILVGSENEGVVVTELQLRSSWCLRFFLKECIVVALVKDDLLLSQADVLEHFIEVDCPLTNVVI